MDSNTLFVVLASTTLFGCMAGASAMMGRYLPIVAGLLAGVGLEALGQSHYGHFIGLSFNAGHYETGIIIGSVLFFAAGMVAIINMPMLMKGDTYGCY